MSGPLLKIALEGNLRTYEGAPVLRNQGNLVPVSHYSCDGWFGHCLYGDSRGRRAGFVAIPSEFRFNGSAR
jgi:hypothetical protein